MLQTLTYTVSQADVALTPAELSASLKDAPFVTRDTAPETVAAADSAEYHTQIPQNQLAVLLTCELLDNKGEGGVPVIIATTHLKVWRAMY